jgi:hypothetical protein
MLIGGAPAGIAEIAVIAGAVRPALRRDTNPVPIGGALAETAETAETPANQVLPYAGTCSFGTQLLASPA